METQTQNPGQSGQRNRRRRRGGRNRGGRRQGPGAPSLPPVKKQNAILAFFARLFGASKQEAAAVREERPERAERTERTERADRPERRERSERGDRRDRYDRPERGERRERPARQEEYRPASREEGEPAAELSESAPVESAVTAESAPEVPAEVTTPRLYVGNLSFEMSESDLFELFSQVGGVRNTEVVRDKETHTSKGFGFVEMESIDVAKAAADKFNGFELEGRALKVNGSKPVREERGDRRGGDRDRRGGGRDRGPRGGGRGRR